ncbi:right-handed parallel beta-helix repeat-containing protein [Herbiconiux sp. SYSU D00978]|uniref:right-handed parallel beta-helix repeat-containing protein n=1 Tax=Herbiconiux sp. SYSU D00978 TaxID=2812562 RepID=UPI001A9572D1|nr:right-handed parallel beta-helix repeat-containing protein [Herbiconiux sp. SYSU D00978]
MSGRLVAALCVVMLLTGATLAAGLFITFAPSGESGPDARGRNEIAANGAVQGELYPGDPVAEAVLVAQEDDRIEAVRAVASTAPWNDLIVAGPFRMTVDGEYTLVLPARPEPYTVADLRALAPDTFVEEEPGVFLLTENLVVSSGATLALAEGTVLRLLSTPERFTSVVGLGGTLDLAGTGQRPVSITSWDPAASGPDTNTVDGRAYLRVLGGYAAVQSVELTDLGFWSGNTGGFALTGTGGEVELAGDPARVAPSPVAGAQTLPEEFTEVAVADSVDLSTVSAELSDVTATGNAYGVFVANATNVTIADSLVAGSLVDGIAFHRHVTDSRVTGTTSQDNAVDGLSLARSSRQVLFDGVVATGNGRNGVSLDAQPLADGPSAIGTTVEEFGDNEISGGVFRDNGRYGVEVNGGVDTRVRDALIEANDNGIVVGQDADSVLLTGNELVGNVTQGIAIRDGVRGVEIRDNTIAGGDTGVYVRNAAATVEDNRLADIMNHGVTVVGDASDVVVRANTIGGSGSIAIWTEDSEGARVVANDLEDWLPAATVTRVLGDVFQPLTVIWLTLALVLVVTALTRRGRQFTGVRNPYADHAPLTTLTPGVVSRESLGRVAS